jgi:hypothetical protein
MTLKMQRFKCGLAAIQIVSDFFPQRCAERMISLGNYPAKSRVRVRENQAGEVTIHYREHRLVFRELKAASKAPSEGRGAAHSLALPSPRPKSCIPVPNHPWRTNRYQQMKTPTFSATW